MWLKIGKRVAENLFITVVITLAITAIWMQLEIWNYGFTTKSQEDTIICVIYMIMTYITVTLWRNNGEKNKIKEEKTNAVRKTTTK